MDDKRIPVVVFPMLRGDGSLGVFIGVATCTVLCLWEAESGFELGKVEIAFVVGWFCRSMFAPGVGTVLLLDGNCEMSDCIAGIVTQQ